MMMKKNLMAVYFKKMRKMQKEMVLVKGITVVADDYYARKMRKKCLKAWRAKARKTREQIQKVISMMKKKPLVMLTLMNFIGYQVMPREQQSTFGLLDFHSYCTLKNRFRPNRATFALNLGQALKARLRQIVKAWKYQTTRITKFKAQVVENQKRRVFQAIDRQCALAFRLRLLSAKREDR